MVEPALPPDPGDERAPEVVLRIRPATVDDAAGVAHMSEHLASPSSSGQVHTRLERITKQPNAQVFVAELPDGTLAGWIQVMLLDLVVSDSGAVVVGLAVDPTRRKLGIGRHLVHKAEAWARSMGCHTVVVRSRDHRKGAQAFYERMGYERHKVQRSFRKHLG